MAFVSFTNPPSGSKMLPVSIFLTKYGSIIPPAISLKSSLISYIGISFLISEGTSVSSLCVSSSYSLLASLASCSIESVSVSSVCCSPSSSCFFNSSLLISSESVFSVSLSVLFELLVSSFSDSFSLVSLSSVLSSVVSLSSLVLSSFEVLSIFVNKSGVSGVSVSGVSTSSSTTTRVSFDEKPALFNPLITDVTVSRKLFDDVNTYDIFKNSSEWAVVYGRRKTRPTICSTSIREVLLASDAKIYAKGQSQPSFKALTVMM